MELIDINCVLNQLSIIICRLFVISSGFKYQRHVSPAAFLIPGQLFVMMDLLHNEQLMGSKDLKVR